MRLLPIALLCCLPASEAMASPIELTTSVRTVHSAPLNCIAIGTTLATCDKSAILIDDLTGSQTSRIVATAEAGFGRVSAFGSETNFPRFQSAHAEARAEFTDVVTLFAPTSGSVRAVFEVTAAGFASAGQGSFQGCLETCVSYFIGGFSGRTEHLFLRTPLLSFSSGDSFELSGAAFVDSVLMQDGSSRISTFGILRGFELFGEDGSPLSTYGVQSAAGAEYATVVPEPTTILMLGTGCVALLRRRRR